MVIFMAANVVHNSSLNTIILAHIYAQIASQ